MARKEVGAATQRQNVGGDFFHVREKRTAVLHRSHSDLHATFQLVGMGALGNVDNKIHELIFDRGNDIASVFTRPR